VRYRVTGQFAATGTVTATFARGSWQVIQVSGTSVGSITDDPATGTTPVDLGAPSAFATNARTVDLAFAVPAGATIDANTIGDFKQVVLGGAGLGSVSIDTAFAPQLAGDGKTVRYWLQGAF